MKFPRLELRWRKSDTKKDGDMVAAYAWACDYVLVLFPATVGDIRSNAMDEDGNDCYCSKDVEYVLNTSYRGGGGEPYAGDTPFREGCHAQWDAAALGGLPIYSVYKGEYKLIPPNEKTVKTAKSRLDGTDPGLRKNRNENDLTD